MLLVAHAAFTFMMTGLIWFVQVVHYPLLAKVGSEVFVHYEREHCDRTGFIAGPLMVAEAFSAAWLLWLTPSTLGVRSALVQLGAVLVAIIWASTFLVQSPQHGRLCEQRDPEVIAALVRGNWLRTVLWTVRSGLVAALMLI